MTWISNSNTKSLAEDNIHLLPKDFDAKAYLNLNPDLAPNGVNTKQKAIEHYLICGIKEKRLYCIPSIKKIVPQQYEHIESQEIWNNNQNLLFFAPTAPDYNMSSGGNRLLQMLKILKQDLGYNVHFFCNGFDHIDHINIVKKLHIPVFLPDISNNHYHDYHLKKLKQDGLIFDNVIFAWYDIARQYFDIVTEIFPNIKTIIDTVDVHWLREQRGKNEGLINVDQSALDAKKQIEKYFYSKANALWTVTENDKKVIQDELGYNNNIKIVSNIHEHKNITLGKNIFFIGNYAHQPNIYGALESIKIYNIFMKTQEYTKNKPKLYIVGPNINDDIVEAANNNPNIIISGKIENLTELYKNNTLLIAPLNWGAGIKGKICDAGMNGIPILTSDIGNEGINLQHQHNALIANSTSEFVQQLQYFFSQTKKKQKQLGKNAQEHLKKLVSVSAAKNIMLHTLQDKHIVISIVCHNQPERLKKCLELLLDKTKYLNYTVVISDNSDNDDTKYMISKYFGNIRNIEYIKYKKNTYFIYPNNKVINDVKYKNSDILLLNDDIEIISNYWLNYLYSAAYTADYIGASGGKTIYPNGLLAEAGAEIYNSGHGKNKGRNQDPNQQEFNIPHYTGYCSGCLLYLRRDVINKIGSLDDQLDSMYYEDSEWQYRAHIHGYKTLYEPRCIAIHDEGSTSGTDITKGTKKFQEINRLKIIEKYKGIDIEQYN